MHAAAVAAHAVVVVAADGADRKSTMETNDMIPKTSKTTIQIFLAVLLAGTLLTPTLSFTQQPSATGSKAASQKSFATPQAAVDALIKAAGDYDAAALLEIFGPSAEDFISSADPVRDKTNAVAFAAHAREKNSVTTDPAKPNRAVLVVGNNDYPFPVPLVKKNGKWFFDSKAGHNEILYRRIGTNELDAIQVCRGYVDAQTEYASTIHDNSGVNQYAQKIISTSGKQDGLYWQNPDGTSGGPIGEAVAKAIEEGYSVDKKSAYHGYYFKILKGQGPAAHLGKLDYVIQGAMIGGFALIAAPAEYRVTGVKTFMVSQDGVVYQKDLGPNTLVLAKQIDRFNPDKTWQPTDDEWPATDDASDSAAAQ